MSTTAAPLTAWPSAPPDDGLVPASPPTAAQSCDSALTGDAATTCAAYTRYSRYLTMGGSALTAAAITATTALKKSHRKTAATDVWAGCGAVYTVVKGMDDAFLEAIVDLNAGKPFAPVDPPSDLPDFPDAPSGDDAVIMVIDDAWTLVAGAIELVVGRLADGPLKVALDGSLTQGKTAFEKLVPILDRYFGSH